MKFLENPKALKETDKNYQLPSCTALIRSLKSTHDRLFISHPDPSAVFKNSFDVILTLACSVNQNVHPELQSTKYKRIVCYAGHISIRISIRN